MTIYKYPYRPPVPHSGNDADGPTEAVDYVAIRRSRIKFKDDNKYYGENLPSNDVERIYNPDAVYIAMPHQLQTQYNPSYSRTDVGVAGVMAASLMAGDASQGDLNQVAQSIQAAAAGGMPEFATSLIAGAANSLNNVLGLAGNVNANSLSALSKGKVFNPFTEQVFNSMAFRTHVFNFKFLSRDEREAQQVKSIIDYLKIGSAPIIMGGDIPDITRNAGAKGDAKENITKTADHFGIDNIDDHLSTWNSTKGKGVASAFRFLEVPDKYHLKFMRLDPGESSLKGSNEHGLHFRMHTSVCTGMNVNYTPDGQYTSFKRLRGDTVNVPAIQVTISFTETRMITQRDTRWGY